MQEYLRLATYPDVEETLKNSNRANRRFSPMVPGHAAAAVEHSGLVRRRDQRRRAANLQAAPQVYELAVKRL